MKKTKTNEYKYIFIIILVALLMLSLWPSIKNSPQDEKDITKMSTKVVDKKTNKVLIKEYKVTPASVIKNKKISYVIDNQYDLSNMKTIKPKNNTYFKADNKQIENQTKFYNLLINQFDFTDLEKINNAHVILDPTDFLERKPLFNLPKYIKKSILTEDDIKNVAKRVQYLRSRNNNVGAYITLGSLENIREDVLLQNLEADIDYSLEYKRSLLSGDEYLPLGKTDTGKPTDSYEDFIKYRISQIKRAGFDFVYFGQIDPYIIFNYDEEQIAINPTINQDEYRKFIMRIFYYATRLKLKICISDFPSLFINYEKELVNSIHYINAFAIDARTFIKPSDNFIKECKKLPIFLSTIYNDNVIDNFINITNWPRNSILYEMTPIKNPFPVDLETVVINKQNINWYPLPPKIWNNGILSESKLPIILPEIIENVMQVRTVYPPITIPNQPKVTSKKIRLI